MKRLAGVVLAGLLLVAAATPLRASDAPARWYVDNAAPPGGDGSESSPFVSLADALRAGVPGVIVLRGGGNVYEGGIALKGGQSLIGEGRSAPVIASARDVVMIEKTGGDVTLANLIIRADGSARGIVARDTEGTITLRDVSVTSTGATAIDVSGVKKLVAAGANTVASVDAAALLLSNTDLDAVFRSVSARGSRLERGIVLQRTTGSLVVEGRDGVADSGGVIDGASVRAISAVSATGITLRRMKLTRSASANGVAPASCGGDLRSGTNVGCNAAVYLRDVTGATLDTVVIDGSGQAGIVAHSVGGFTLAGSEVKNVGNEPFEHGMVLQEMNGDFRIADSSITASASRNLMLHNSRGTAALLIERTTFADTTAPNGQQGVMIAASGDASLSAKIVESRFMRNFSHGVEVTASGESRARLTVNGCSFDENATAVNLSAIDLASIDYDISDNAPITRSKAVAINVYLGSPSRGTLSGTIARNVIGSTGIAKSGTACRGCSGISIAAAGHGAVSADVTENIIQQVGGPAIVATAGNGSARARFSIRSNLIREPESAGAPAIRVSAASLATDTTAVCGEVGGAGVNANTIEGEWDPAGAIQLLHRFAEARFSVAGLSEPATETAAAIVVAARNHGVKVRSYLRPGSDLRFEPAERCEMPGPGR